MANERASLRRIAMTATNILLAYPTTEKEDVEWLGYDPDDDDDNDDDDAFDDDAFVDSASASAEDADATISDGDDFDAAAAAASTDPPRRMPRRLRVHGGLVHTAVVLRLREKRLLKRAVYWLKNREDDLDALTYQVEEKARAKREAEEKIRARAERAAELMREYATAKTLATATVDVPAATDASAGDDAPPAPPRRASVAVREGDVLDDVVTAFIAATDGLDHETHFTPIRDALIGSIVPRPRLIARVPVIVPSGEKAVVAIRDGDDPATVVATFCELHNVPAASVTRLDAMVKTHVANRAKRRSLISIPVVAPDGRALLFDVVEGEQHELLARASEWALAERVPQDAAAQLANAAHERLGPVLVAIPVEIPGRGGAAVTLFVRDAAIEAVRATAEAFAEAHGLGAVAAIALTREISSRLNPGTMRL